MGEQVLEAEDRLAFQVSGVLVDENTVTRSSWEPNPAFPRWSSVLANSVVVATSQNANYPEKCVP